ncbi:hypothetical protein [Skermanella pratensis]|uniref:hypothetical protein n=1 Tax=Skermanella pratensis TaxID=2233999 RepID=UPI001301069D|nr:hypothetical protein [Skermanella pratensis]
MIKQSGQWKVAFCLPSGEPVDLWYTTDNYDDARSFATEVQAADQKLIPKITRTDGEPQTPKNST